jgi:protein N-terminal methyltransferase
MEQEINNLNKDEIYKKCKEFWSQSESTLNGVLNGNENVHFSDVKTSSELLQGLIKTKKLKPGCVIDCGAGIGRVTSAVLVNYFNECDLVEQDEKFISHCRKELSNFSQVKEIYQSSLQDFIFTKKYDAIWIQWCLENLDDRDLSEFIIKCKSSLNENGLVIVKENIVSKGIQFSSQDYSKVRSDLKFKELFEQTGLKIIKHFHHPNWPKDLLKVSIYVLTNI